MAGKIQNQDIKSSAELALLGASDADLPNDDKVYVTANTINKTLKQAIIDGDIGGGGSGKNYFPNAASSGQSTSGFNAFADAAASLPVDGTGGSPSGNLLLASSASSPLSGAYSFTLTKSNSVSTQGEGYSRDFTIDPSDKGKVLAFTMNYGIVSGTYADNDLIIYFYDVTNGVLLEPVPYKIKNHGLVSDRFFCELQVPYNCSTLRWIIYQSSATTQNYQIKIDDLLFGPQAKLYGSATTDPVAYTPIFTGFGTVTNINVRSWRSGKFLFVDGSFTSGTPTATEGRISLGYNGANSSVSTASTYPTIARVGDFNRNTSSTVFFSHGTILAEASKSYMTLGLESSTTNGLTKQNGNGLVTAGDNVSFNAKFEIEGWGSSQVLSNDTDTRVVAAVMSLDASVTTVNPNNSNVKLNLNKKLIDTHGGVSTGSYLYLVTVPGFYELSARSALQGTNVSAGALYYISIYKNGSEVIRGQGYVGTASTGVNLTASGLVSANAGDYFELYIYSSANHSASNLTVYGDTSDAAFTSLSISRLSGPAQIVISETAAARYKTSAGQSIANASTVIIDFGAKEYDSHGSVTTGGSWKFTALYSGIFEVNARITYSSGTFTSGNQVNLFLYKNGLLYSELGAYLVESTLTLLPRVQGIDKIKLLAGDYIDIRTAHGEATSRSLYNDSAYNYVTIERIGNY